MSLNSQSNDRREYKGSGLVSSIRGECYKGSGILAVSPITGSTTEYRGSDHLAVNTIHGSVTKAAVSERSVS